MNTGATRNARTTPRPDPASSRLSPSGQINQGNGKGKDRPTMNRIALSIALALGLAAGVPASASADRPALGDDSRAAPPSWFDAAPEGGIARLGDPEAGVPEVADRMVKAINAADYEGLRRDFNKVMLDAFPVEKCRTFFSKEISGKFGKINTLEPPQVKSAAEAVFVARCERGTLDFTLVLDEHGRVAGMLFRPRSDLLGVGPDGKTDTGDGSRNEDDSAFGRISAKGRRSYSEERALGDARLQLEQAVADWLAPDVPADWTPPADLIDALILERHVEPVAVDRRHLGLVDDPDLTVPETLYVAALRADLSTERRDAFLDAHRRQIGAERTTLLGGLAGFVLACLAILALYIRADEATRGYYTNRLRLVALASAGATGLLLYRLLA